MLHFNEMGFPAPLMQSLDRLGFSTPTPIQAQTIPLALNNSDVLGSAETGTGKTLAFILPTVTKLLNNPNESALVLTPTRELAQQVMATVTQLFGHRSSMRTALLIGGEPYPKQLTQLKGRPQIVIGTPGRVIDHLGRGTLKSNTITTLILDETDRMLDMGFGIQLDQIIDQLPKERQTLMFSATFLPKIEKLAASYLRTPERIFMNAEIKPVQKIVQETIKIRDGEKYENLLSQINEREGAIIIFVKTKMNAEKLATNLLQKNHSVSAIHGDLRQHKRDRVMRDFRSGRYRIMVATDVAARGLDVPAIKHVINYDLPQSPEDYVHRIGRTARNGAEGSALNFVSPADSKKWDAIQRLLDPTKEYKERTDMHQRGQGHSRGGSSGPRSRSPFSDRSPTRERRFSEGRPSYGDRRSSGDRTPAFGERRRPMGEGNFARRDSFDRQPSSLNRQDRFDDRQPSSFQGRPATRDRQSGFQDRSSFNNDRGFNNDRPSFRDRDDDSFGNREGNARKTTTDRFSAAPSFRERRNDNGNRPASVSRPKLGLGQGNYYRDFGNEGGNSNRPARPFGGNSVAKKPGTFKKDTPRKKY